jgi:ribonuclease HI
VLYESTKVMWIKRWLAPEENRPKWAWAANAILESCKQNSPRVDTDAITEWIEQRWRVKIRTEKMPDSLRKMLYAAQKYNVKISVLRAPITLKLSMPAFFHPAIKQKRINNSKASRCLRQNHGIETVGDLLDFARADDNPMEERCQRTWRQCKQHAKKLINLLPDLWNPTTTTPAQNRLYHTPRRLERYRQTDIREMPIAFNPDINASERILENVRIFGIREGYKTRSLNQYTPAQPARVREIRSHGTPRAPGRIEIYTDGSTKRNGWENSTAGIGNWHAEDSDRNQSLALAGAGQTNQRAELAAIALALQSNGGDDLLIFSDSLTSLNAICGSITKWEDIGWHKVKNADFLMEILSLLRTRPSICEFKWVKAHDQNEGNNHADRLADEGRLRDDIYMPTMTNPTNTRELHDGARLSTLKMRDIYSILIQRLTEGKSGPKHPEYIDDAQDMVERETGLRPTKEALINGIWKTSSYNRLRDHLWNMLLGRLKCGGYWRHIPDFEDRAYCSFCTANGEREREESEQHLWLDCQYNSQSQAWKTARRLWAKTTTQRWPRLSIGLLRGIGAVTLTDFQGGPTRDMSSERLRIIISMTIWAIWKNRNNYAIQNRPVALSDASNLLIELLKDLITKSCNALKFETDKHRERKRLRLRKLWAHGKLVIMEPGQAPTFDF